MCRLFAVEIGSERFYMDEEGEVDRIFAYCEKRFDFNGVEWENIKTERDYEAMGELIENKGVEYQEIVE